MGCFERQFIALIVSEPFVLKNLSLALPAPGCRGLPNGNLLLKSKEQISIWFYIAI